jgi:hypothetical protein
MNRRIALLSLIGLAGMAACTSPVTGDKEVDTGKGYVIKTIDGCQYLEVSSLIGANNGYYSITHKGNCNNPIHRLDKSEKSVTIIP